MSRSRSALAARHPGHPSVGDWTVYEAAVADAGAPGRAPDYVELGVLSCAVAFDHAWRRVRAVPRPDGRAGLLRHADLDADLVVVDPGPEEADRSLVYIALGEDAVELARRVTIAARLPLGSVTIR